MFNKLFNRGKPPTPSPTDPAPLPVDPVAPAPSKSRLDDFRNEWDAQHETSADVIEGDGGNTDWGAWTDAVEEEEKSFAPTVPMPLKRE